MGIDCVVATSGGTGACIASGIGNAGGVQRDDVGGVGGAGVGCERGRPGDAAITAGEVGEGGIGGIEVSDGETADRLGEGDGDGGGITDF